MNPKTGIFRTRRPLRFSYELRTFTARQLRASRRRGKFSFLYTLDHRVPVRSRHRREMDRKNHRTEGRGVRCSAKDGTH